jgi:hypothetical protein
LARGHLLGTPPVPDAPHYVQIGDAPVFAGAGEADLRCRCGRSTLVKGYLPANFLSIRIRCFQCGAVTVTPALPDGAVLPNAAVGVAPNETAAVVPISVPRGAVLICQDAMAHNFARTRPRAPLPEPARLVSAMIEAVAAQYDRLSGGRLVAQMAESPPAMGSAHGDHPFAWALSRLRRQIVDPDWTWLRHNDDAMAALYVVAMQDLLHSWGEHPLFAQLASPLTGQARFLPTLAAFALAKLLFEAGNRVRFDPPAAGGALDVQLGTATGEPLSLALLAPDALQWKERDRRNPPLVRAAVLDALAAAQARVNARRPGIVVLSVSILEPDFDQMLADSINAALRGVGRRHRGVAAVAAVMPKVLRAPQPDRIGFGHAFYPIRNPHFAGDNPIRLGLDRDFDLRRPPA